VPIAVCELEATAIRLARGQYVQGSDGPVRPAELVQIDGTWYAPLSAVQIIKPTPQDQRAQAAHDARKAALDKAKQAGLTADDLAALRGEPT